MNELNINMGLSEPTPAEIVRGGWRWFRWRGLVLVAVFACGLIAFCNGVDVTDRRGVPDADFMTKIYYTLGLFLFGGLDLGMPVGGPLWTRAMLWLVYFAAPAVTTSAIAEGILRAVGWDRFQLRHLHDHVVVGGCGRLAILYLDRLHKMHPNLRVVIVEKEAHKASAQIARRRFHAHVITGDIDSEAVMHTLNLNRAARLVLLTGDDYVNLSAASRAAHIAPRLASATLVHISDIRLFRLVEPGAGLPAGAVKFNSNHRAARYLVTESLLPHFQKSEYADVVVLAGFGRFGQSLLDELQRHAADSLSKVAIIDREADLMSMVFDQQVGFGKQYEHEVLEADLRHPRTWQQIEPTVIHAVNEPVFILSSGDDGVNIRTALWLSQKYPHAKIIARCFQSSAFTKEISEQCQFEIVSTLDLVHEGMQPEWFELLRPADSA